MIFMNKIVVNSLIINKDPRISFIEDFPLNIQLFYLINHARHPFLDWFYKYFYLLGKGFILIPATIIVLIFASDYFIYFLLAMILQGLVIGLLKNLLKVRRPSNVIKDAYVLEPIYHKSFPSGDTAVAFLIVSFLTFVGVPFIFQILAWFYALLIGYGRIYFGVHFPLDVVVGGIIGFFTFRIIIALSLIVF